ncbi:uncharacterized protein LOC121731198 [Aricia agestis]|uniref:uncharacterized protein LOC121731198 n=1 Tax=Aricia agestis TaxID=91739 RepID=UPI001C20BAA1|nr:uncharacterized protein LOC121731198 [Aricia agestis]
MRQIIAFCVLAVAAAAPALKLFTHPENTLLSYDSENGGTSNEIVLKPQINYRYKNGPSDNRKTGGRGELDRLIDEILVSYSWDDPDGVKSFSWVGPDGVKYTLKFVTDESPEDQTSLPQDVEEEPPGSGPISPSCLASLCG